jgi:hypothetical protein
MVFASGVFQSFVGGHALSVGRPGSPGSHGASPYPHQLRSTLAAIPLVLVVVLDLLRHPQRAGDACRPGSDEASPYGAK